MAKKPTYEALEKRVAALEAKARQFDQMQGEFKRNLSFTESLLASIPTPVFYKDHSARYIGCNQAFTEIMGVTAEQIRGKTVEDLWPSDHARTYHRKDLELLENTSHQIYEFEIRDKHARIRPVIYYKNVFRDENGKVAGIVGGFVDISEIREAHNEILERQRFLEAVLFHAPDAIITLDVDRRVIGWNPGAVTMFGYSPEEAIGAQLDDLVAGGNHRTTAGTKADKILSGRRVEAFTAVRYRKDGTPIHVIASGSPILVEGILKGGVAVYTDISDRVRNEEALRISHQRFITVLDSIDATVYVADMQTHEILFMNKNMIETFGSDLIGKKCWTVFNKETAPCPHCTNDRLVDEKGRPTGVVIWQGKNPISQKWYINYDRAIEWIDGRIVRLQIATDITGYKKMEAALWKAQKMEAIGTLASGIAHNFNNLLLGIQGRASLIAVDLEPGHPHAEHTAAINEYIQSAVNLTRQLLGFAQGGKYEVKPLDINELLESSADMFGRTSRGIRISTKTWPEPMVVEADRRQIEQVLLNIYVNARQAMPNGGDLICETTPVALDRENGLSYPVLPGRYVKISITDTGLGMTEEVLQKVFDPFFTTKEKGRGTGLGLASAHGIVTNHGGMIRVDSKVAQGSTFIIYLPRSGKAVEPDRKVEETLVGGVETVLLIDDEAMVRDVGKAMLEKMGYRVVTAESGEAAVSQIAAMGGDVDLVILDLIMPGMDGGSVFDKIRELEPLMPVVLSSGYSIDGQAMELMERGCNGFIQKPYSIKEFGRKIREILDERKRPPQ